MPSQSKVQISIILPTFNASQCIHHCLESIEAQTFPNYEVVVVDGQSSDNTPGIVISFVNRNSRIGFISEKDGGIYDAMNKGIDKASGEWLYFLGSDDYLINDNVLDMFIKTINLENYDFVYGNVESPEFGEKYDGPFDENKILSKNICHQAIFIKRELFSRIGKFNIKYKLLADYDFNLRVMFNKAVRKKYIDLTIAYYAPSGLSSTKTDQAFLTDKNELVLKYAFSYLSWRQRFQYLRDIIKSKFAGA